MSKRVLFCGQNVSGDLHNARARLFLATFVASAVALVGAGCRGPVDEEAHKVWLQKRGQTKVVVLPAIVRRGQTIEHDVNSTTTIIDFVNTRGFGTARSIDARITPGPWRTNQAKMLGETAVAIADWRKKQSLSDADFVVTVEAMFLGGTGELGGVHLYVVDAEGRFADAVLLNSHHQIFQQRKPTTVDACVRMALDAWKMDYPDEAEK